MWRFPLLILTLMLSACVSFHPYGLQSQQPFQGALMANGEPSYTGDLYQADVNGDGYLETIVYVPLPPPDDKMGEVAIWWGHRTGESPAQRMSDLLLPSVITFLLIEDVDQDGTSDFVFFDVAGRRTVLLRGRDIPRMGELPSEAMQTLFKPRAAQISNTAPYEVRLLPLNTYLEQENGNINIVLRMRWHDPLNPELGPPFELVYTGPTFHEHYQRPQFLPLP